MTTQQFKCLIDIYNSWIFRGIPSLFLTRHSGQPAFPLTDFKAGDLPDTLSQAWKQQSIMGVSKIPVINHAGVSPLFSGATLRDQRGREINAIARKRPSILKNNYSSMETGSAIDSPAPGKKMEHTSQWRDGP
jgi:hypothetical protein